MKYKTTRPDRIAKAHSFHQPSHHEGFLLTRCAERSFESLEPHNGCTTLSAGGLDLGGVAGEPSPLALALALT
jgi:hypothetical protein